MVFMNLYRRASVGIDCMVNNLPREGRWTRSFWLLDRQAATYLGVATSRCTLSFPFFTTASISSSDMCTTRVDLIFFGVVDDESGSGTWLRDALAFF